MSLDPHDSIPERDAQIDCVLCGRWHNGRYAACRDCRALYFTYGWSWLDDAERAALREQAGRYGCEFAFHARYRPARAVVAEFEELS